MLSPRDRSDTTTRTAPPRGERYARNQALINQRAKLNAPPNAAHQRHGKVARILRFAKCVTL